MKIPVPVLQTAYNIFESVSVLQVNWLTSCSGKQTMRKKQFFSVTPVSI